MANKSEYKNIFLQGFMGVGLVGYLIIESIAVSYKDQIKVINTYPEFFPRIVTIEEGNLTPQKITISLLEIDDKKLYLLYGPQPEEETMMYFTTQTIIKDIEKIHKQNPIDLYLAFGAFMNDFKIPTVEREEEAEKKAEEVINNEYINPRIIRYAKADFDPEHIIKNAPENISLEQSEDGVITGLNGFMPTLVNQKLGIPSLAVMVETSIIRAIQGVQDPLSTYFGLTAAKAGILFLNKVMNLSISLEHVDNFINKVKNNAKEELTILINHATIEARHSQKRNIDTSQYV